MPATASSVATANPAATCILDLVPSDDPALCSQIWENQNVYDLRYLTFSFVNEKEDALPNPSLVMVPVLRPDYLVQSVVREGFG